MLLWSICFIQVDNSQLLMSKYRLTGPRQFICPCPRLFDLSEVGFELDAQYDIVASACRF